MTSPSDDTERKTSDEIPNSHTLHPPRESLSLCIQTKSLNSLNDLMKSYQQKLSLPERRRSHALRAQLSDFHEQIDALPRALLNDFIPFSRQCILDPIFELLRAKSELSAEQLTCIETISRFCTLLLTEYKDFPRDNEAFFQLAQSLHDTLLSIQGPTGLKLAAQDAISVLCETCWHLNAFEAAQTLVTQVLPFLIVRSHECSSIRTQSSHFMRRLYAIREAFLQLDFQHESCSLLKTILLRSYLQPKIFRAPDAISFMAFLFEIDTTFADDIDQTIRNQIPDQRKSVLRKYGSIYFKGWIASKDQCRQKIEDYLQRYIHEAVHAASADLFYALRSLLLIFFENKRHEGIERMLYKICSPILWRAVRAANDPVRRQAAVLIFDNFPIRDPDFNNEMMDQILQKQFDIAEMLLLDSNPLIRVAGILGVSKILSVYWDLLPETAIQLFIPKLFQLANDKSSSAVRAAFFDGLRVVLENHLTHGILKPLLPQLAPLINDHNDRVRSEFVLLLLRVKSIRNLHFYDIVSIEHLLHRMVLDSGRKLIRNNLILLFLNSYFPLNTSGASQVARCLALIVKDPEAALVFYRRVVVHTSVSSVCKLSALLFQWILSAYEPETHLNDVSVSTRILVLHVIGKLLQSVSIQLQSDPKFKECVSFLQTHFKTEELLSLLKAFEEPPTDSNAEGLCAIWHLIAVVGTVGSDRVFLEKMLSDLVRMDGSSSTSVLDGMVECLIQWKQLDVLGARLEDCLNRWRLNHFRPQKRSSSVDLALHPLVALSVIELLFDRVKNPAISRDLCGELDSRLEKCTEQLMEMKMEAFYALFEQNAQSIVKLLEVDSKVCFSMAVNAIHDQAQRLNEARKTAPANDQVSTLQPASLFLPPKRLHNLIQWILKLLPPLSAGPKKKRKRSSTESQRTKSLQSLRNLLTSILLLLMESIVFGLEVKPVENEAESVRLLQALLSEWARALESMEVFDHIVVYLGHHLLFSAKTLSEDPSVNDIMSECVENLDLSLKKAIKAFPKECDSINLKPLQKIDRPSR
uniref:Condensin2 complex subunit G2 putative n=1 Tax=Albugo laibachii Nc14 TaxID=890382 RepID=F0WAJ6_9STRA|nr:condensin2 complex subunit G2 putative [Albugo laibachii Nc14]|eukprot:CCA18167.1 condensin2 complex subunit G2 putative [Albugo laibachii Nc14]